MYDVTAWHVLAPWCVGHESVFNLRNPINDRSAEPDLILESYAKKKYLPSKEKKKTRTNTYMHTSLK